MWWTAIASALQENNKQSEQNLADEQAKKQMQRQNVLQNRAVTQNELQGITASKQDAYMRQQQVFDNIMKKYNVGGMQ